MTTAFVAARRPARRTLPAAMVCGLMLFSGLATAQEPKATVAAPVQKTFATAKEAADALVAAAEGFDVAALRAILGPDGEELVTSPDPVQDKAAAATFATKAREKMAVVTDPQNANRAIVSIGSDDWPLPIPIVRKSGAWHFDSIAGREEILYRRIGENELDAIQICRGFVEAQHEYALQNPEGAAVNQYAQRIISSPGKKDGLAWRNPDETWGGPVGEAIARAIEQGYSEPPVPYHGYYFKVLKGQGPAAPMGEMDFVVKGMMIGGFALLASPAEHLVTGVKSFMVSHDGVVYEKDFGEKTLDSFKATERYNPDATWKPVPEE